jgi:hypothetical protein
MNSNALLLAAVLALGLPMTALADEAAGRTPGSSPNTDQKFANEAAPDVYPYVEGVINLELDDDWIFHSSDPDSEFNNLYLSSNTAAFKFGLTQIFSINLGLTLEQVKDPNPPRNCTMCNIGLYMDTLDLQADIGNWTLTAGKHEPAFGFAWDVAPGVFGTNYAEDYELSEVWGVGAAYTFNTDFGKHTLAVNTFFADTTVLSESIFTNRGQAHVGDGGAGNTGRLDNFAVTLFGEEMPSLPGLKYNIGYRHLSAGSGDFGDENGVVAGLAKDTEIGNGLTLGLLGEVAYFQNYGGADEDALYATLGASLKKGPWHGELTGEIRDFRVAGTDQLVQVSAGYEFDNGLDLSLGYGHEHVAGEDNDMLGVRLTKCFSFSTGNKKPEC